MLDTHGLSCVNKNFNKGAAMKQKLFAGIGSRKTPQHVLAAMAQWSNFLTANNHTLRSGGAIGADGAFQAGARISEIFTAKDSTPQAEQLASEFHPNWKAIQGYSKGLMGRNMMIICGKNLDKPVDFVICWTPNGAQDGGTGQALRYAQHLGIPVYNLFYKYQWNKLWEYCNVIEESHSLKYQPKGR